MGICSDLPDGPTCGLVATYLIHTHTPVSFLCIDIGVPSLPPPVGAMRLYRGRFKYAGPRGFDLLRRALHSSKPAISPRALRLLRKKYACRAASRLLRSDHCLGSSWVLRHHTSCTNLHAAVGVGVRVRRRYPCVLRTTTGTNIFCTRTGQL